MLQTISHLNQVLQGVIAGGALTSAAIVLELVLRLIPSQKPLSIAYMAADILHGCGELSKSAGDALDKVLPNRVK